jgi:hypothetical protein
MKLFIQCRGFRTKVEMLFGNGNSGLLIQTLADKQTKEKNVSQIRAVLKTHEMHSDYNFLVSLAATVFIAPTPDKNLYVAGSPHIACGFFDRHLNLYPGAFQSKIMKGNSSNAEDAKFNNYTLVKQKFVLGAHYHSKSGITNHFFQLANNTASSTSSLSNGKEENALVNAGGSFYLLAIKPTPCFTTFKRGVALYNQKSLYYDRINDSCAHAVLESLDINITDRYALDTQTALARILKHFSLNEPIVLTDCLKDPITLGYAESYRLQSRKDEDRTDIVDYIKSHFHCRVD